MDDEQPQDDVTLPQPGGGPHHPVPFAEVRWKPPSRASRLLTHGLTITLRITPYLITAWIVAPAEVKYELRKQARWLPWAVRYAAWWLRQEGW